MSMNIHISATREVTVNKTGETSSQSVMFDCWQTPTSDSYEIMKKENPLEGYKEWVIARNDVGTFLVYEEGDFFKEREPIGETTVNYSEIHVNELNEWIEMCEEGGYEIEVEVW
jgi:hypothetical protein